MSGKNDLVQKVDPITFEVLRHRLWAINDEQGVRAARVSGTPAIYEVFDFNTGILTAKGRGVFVGVYIGHHAIPLEQVVRSTRERFGEDIEPGDMFFTNDPWCGALHANDGALAAPVFWDGEIVCWTAIAMHDMDVGGPVTGSFVVGARECFGEAPLYPPIRLVRQGTIQQDVYSVLRRNCRVPDMNYLNMKARISSQVMTRNRIHELIKEYGKDTFVNVLEQIINHTNFVLKSRLNQIPDGVWWEYGFLDHDGISNRSYKLVVKLTKEGTRLTFDFSGTAPQAIGSVNCTSSGLRGGVIAPLLAMLYYDLPWSTGALDDILEIKAEEGTINNAKFPAGCSMASIQATWATQNVASNAIAKMLCCSSTYKEEAQACWMPYWNGVMLSGQDQHGQNFVHGMMDAGAGGIGARTFRDGIDCGGQIQSLCMAIPNVETNEYVQPVLEIYRKYCPDTCGHGMYRGGVGIEYAYTPLGTPKPIDVVIVASAVSVPDGRGLFGGYPASTNSNVVLRQSNVLEIFKRGSIPTGVDEIQAASREILQAKTVTHLPSGDVHVSMTAGGGGYGDSLKRDPELVCYDVSRGLITRDVAMRVYGVVFKPDQISVDHEETIRTRERILAERKARARICGEAIADKINGEGIEAKDITLLRIVSDFLELRASETNPSAWFIYCRSCGEPICPAEANIREYMARSHPIPIDFLSSVNSLCVESNFFLIEYSCVSCGILLSTDIVRDDELETVQPEFAIPGACT